MSASASQMDYVLPNELVDGMIAAGGKKATVSVKNLLIRGFYSGAILGLAVILALTIGLKSGQPWLGSLIFPFGFASIVLFGMELVTGNFALLPMSTWAGKSTWRATFRNWGWVWLGNWIGTAVVALIMAISLTSGGTVDPASAADGVACGNRWLRRSLPSTKPTLLPSTRTFNPWASSWPSCVELLPTGWFA